MNASTAPVPVSRMCHWYRKGDLHVEPLVAMITGVNQDNSIDLAIFGRGTVHIEVKDAVRHRDDPFLKKRPNHAKENGVWDYLPGQTPSAEPTEDQEMLVLEIQEKLGPHATPAQIAGAVREATGANWTHQRVGQVLRKYAKP